MAGGLLGTEGGIIKEKAGSYNDNKLDKKWTYWESDGRKAEEITFEKGIKNGKYIFWNSDNNKTIDGNYLNGKKHGYMEFVVWRRCAKSYGTIMQMVKEMVCGHGGGQMVLKRRRKLQKSVKHGLWTTWTDKDHKKGEETYVNGLLDGLVVVWHENGNKDRGAS